MSPGAALLVTVNRFTEQPQMRGSLSTAQEWVSLTPKQLRVGFLISGAGREATGQEEIVIPPRNGGGGGISSLGKETFPRGQRGHSLGSGWHTEIFVFSEGRNKNVSTVGTWNALQREQQDPLGRIQISQGIS